MLGGEDGYVLQIRDRLGRGVSSARMSGLKWGGCAMAIVASSYGMPTPTGSPNGRGWEAYEGVSNLGVGISTVWMFGGVQLGGVAEQRGD